MRFLVVCNSPASQLMAFTRWLAGHSSDEIFFVCVNTRESLNFNNVQRIVIKNPASIPPIKSRLDAWKNIISKAQKVRQSIDFLANKRPEIILANSAKGDVFEIRELFPDSLIVSYPDIIISRNPFLRQVQLEVERAQNGRSDLVFSFDQALVDTDFFTPGGSPRENVIVIHDDMENISVIKGRCELGGINAESKLVSDRVMNPDKMRSLYQSARLIVYKGKKLQPEILEAMSCETPAMLRPELIAGFLKPGENCLAMGAAADDASLLAAIGKNARRTVAARFDLKKKAPEYLASLKARRKALYKS